MSAASSEKEVRYVGVKENLAYGFANAGQVFGYNLVAGGYLSLFFTKVFGIPEEAVAVMIFVLGIWDTINDPLMGSLIDKTRTRFGKLRPYLMIVPIPLSIATIMLFAGPEILADAKSTTVKIVYMYISYFIWEFFYTIGDVPFWGLSTAISPSTADRTRAISSARFISGILGGLSTTLLPVMMDFTNYYYSEVLNLSSAVLWINLPGTIFGFLTYLLIPKLKTKLDNRQIVMLNVICRFVVSTLVFFAGLGFYRTNIVVISILLMIQNFIFSFFNTINSVIPTEMIGDTVDYMEWKTGERNEGVSFSVLTFVGKLTGSVSTSIGTALLPVIGLSFTTNAQGMQVAVKGENTDLYIWALFTIVPYVLGLLTLIPYAFYNLTGKRLALIHSEMAERRSKLAAEVSTGGVQDE